MHMAWSSRGVLISQQLIFFLPGYLSTESVILSQLLLIPPLRPPSILLYLNSKPLSSLLATIMIKTKILHKNYSLA